MKLLKTLATAALATTIAGSAAFATEMQGVTDTEIKIGGNHDMSGIFAAFSAPAVQAANMVFDRVNAEGGIHGRKLTYIVEDHGYQMPKAIAGLNKLLNSDQVAVMLLALGTPMNIAAFPLMEAKGVPNVYPLTAARAMNEPLHPLRYTGSASYYDQILRGAPWLAKEKGVSKLCTMYLPTDFGKEIYEGTKAAAEQTEGLEFVTESTHKPDDSDFVGALQKMNNAGCEIITHALGIRQAITLSGTVKKLGYDHISLLSSSAGFHTVIALVPGGVTEGMYAASGWADLLSRKDVPEVGQFIKDFTEATGEKIPGTGALIGFSGATTLVKALEAAGKDLNQESFRKGMESLKFEDTISGTMVDYSEDDHQGADEVIISVIENGGWKELTRLD